LKKIRSIIVLFLTLSFYLSTMVPCVLGAEDSWMTMEPMPTARYRFGLAVVAGKIYAIGGLASGPLGTNEEYDPATDAWTTKTPMPTPRYYFAVAVYQNKIYTFGGLTELPLQNNTYVGVTEVYDPATDTWETKTSMPTNRSALCANVVNGKIYLISGIVFGHTITFSAHSDLTEVYDPETDTWTEAEPIPTGVRFAGAGTTSGEFAPERIYVIGGSTTQFPDGSNLTQIYDPEKDVWITGAPMPTPRGGLRVAVVNDVLYAIGGFNTNGDNVLAVNEQYTPIGYIPEFPSWIILPLIFVFILVVAVVKRKSFRPT